MYFLFVDDSKFYWVEFSACNDNDHRQYLYAMWINLSTKKPITTTSSATLLNNTGTFGKLNLFSTNPPDTSGKSDSNNVRIYCVHM